MTDSAPLPTASVAWWVLRLRLAHPDDDAPTFLARLRADVAADGLVARAEADDVARRRAALATGRVLPRRLA